ncbi:hypothetical protein PIB30_078787 [Stylosanthes scabra]|uniref:DUF4283 domain-containing protein n=1 Tax=Stylosanthes scabra TaxID=79078 RepID=A0ABU6VS58_9FABA|nr:hypothetical protein [Stylosanthes scabra]
MAVGTQGRKRDTGGSGNHNVKKATKPKGPENNKKDVIVETSQDQVDLLKRSIIAECVRPIMFRWVRDQILKEWKEPGSIECRDLGPYKCVLTLESVEYRNAALRSPMLMDYFDELRPQWGYSRGCSRRIWLEVFGVPIHVWSKDTFWRIGKLWGRPVMLDELTEENRSFSCGKILVDVFQWGAVQEVVNSRVGETTFEVFVREVEERRIGLRHTPSKRKDWRKRRVVEVVEGRLRCGNEEATIGEKEGCINERWDQSRHEPNVEKCNGVGNDAGNHDDKEKGGSMSPHTMNLSDVERETHSKDLGRVEAEGQLGLMAQEETNGPSPILAHHVTNDAHGLVVSPNNVESSSPIARVGLPLDEDGNGQGVEAGLEVSTGSLGSCPFPPGFGPCSNSHVHREIQVGLGEVNPPTSQQSEEGPLTPTESNDHLTAEGGAIEEVRRTLEVCEEGGLQFRSDERELIATKLLNKELGSASYSLRPRTRRMESTPSSDGRIRARRTKENQRQRGVRAAYYVFGIHNLWNKLMFKVGEDGWQ